MEERKTAKRKGWAVCLLLLVLALCTLPVQAADADGGKWVTKKSRKMYQMADGTYAKNTWITIDGGKYLFDENGYALFGMQTWKGNKYYIRKNGGMVTGRFTYRKATYFFLRSGKMARSRWVVSKKHHYYLLDSGKMAKGWLTLDGKTYYLKKSTGEMLTGLKKVDGKRYYFGSDGVLVVSKWVTINGKDYYFKSDGQMATGWLKLGKKKYYLGTDGVKVTGEQWIDGKGYYFKKNGVYDPDVKVTVDPSKPMVAITYDDGPSQYTDRLLDYLEENDAVATFFLVGQYIPLYKDTVKRAYSLGCEIGSHTWDHAYLTKLSVSQIADELEKTNVQIRSITGKNATLVRPPYGAYNSTVLANLHAPAITWSIDTRDWEHRNADKTISNVMNNVKDGDIILMHDSHKTTVDAAERLIPKLKAAGYQLVTVSQLAKYKNKTLVAGVVYNSIR